MLLTLSPEEVEAAIKVAVAARFNLTAEQVDVIRLTPTRDGKHSARAEVQVGEEE